jgi:hypothetical protein
MIEVLTSFYGRRSARNPALKARGRVQRGSGPQAVLEGKGHHRRR